MADMTFPNSSASAGPNTSSLALYVSNQDTIQVTISSPSLTITDVLNTVSSVAGIFVTANGIFFMVFGRGVWNTIAGEKVSLACM